MQKRNSVTAICWVILGSMILIQAVTFPFGNWESPGPGIFPLACGVILIFLGSILFFQSSGKSKRKPDSPPAPLVPPRAALTRVALSVGGMLLSATFLQFLGFFLTIFCLVLSLMRAIQPQRWRVDIFYAFAFTTGSYMLFQVLLKISFPVGVLGF